MCKVVIPDGIVDDFVFEKNEDHYYLSAYIGKDSIFMLPADYKGEDYDIGSYAFYASKEARSINVPEGVTSIGEFAIYDCASLQKVTLPSSLKGIGNGVFGKCKKLKNVICSALVPPNASATDCPENATLYVPTSALSHYHKANYWRNFNIQPLLEENTEPKFSNLTLWRKNAEKVVFALHMNPQITFNKTEMIVSTDGVELNYPLDDLSHFTFENVPETSIVDIKTDDNIFKMDEESVLFPNLKANSSVSVYSLNGVLIFKQITSQNGEYTIPFSNLEHGVYIVKVNGLTYKIIKK